MGKHNVSKPSKLGRTAAMLAVTAAVPAAMALSAPQAVAGELPPQSIVDCESGGNVRAQNPSSTASGKYQFIDGTWLAYGGGKYAPKARLATEAQQDEIAAKLYAAEGTAPWNASRGCWGGKSQVPAQAAAVAPVKKTAPTTSAAPKAEAKAEVKAEAVVKQATTPSSTSGGSTKPAPKPVATVPVGASFTPGGEGVYTVQLGDTLSSLAKANDTTVEALVELNRDIIEMPDWIFAGERIHLK